jgi:hypothetical protein
LSKGPTVAFRVTGAAGRILRRASLSYFPEESSTSAPRGRITKTLAIYTNSLACRLVFAPNDSQSWDNAEKMVEVRGVEPLWPWPSRAASTCIASDWISPPGRDDARSSFGQSWFEDTTATSRRPSPLFLLSTLLSISRCHGRNVAAFLGS